MCNSTGRCTGIIVNLSTSSSTAAGQLRIPQVEGNYNSHTIIIVYRDNYFGAMNNFFLFHDDCVVAMLHGRYLTRHTSSDNNRAWQ